MLRRQAHEATVHTVDVEQVLGDVRPIPTAVGLDGLDEWLEVMVPGALPDGPPEDAHPVVLHAVDADAERTLFPGTRPFPIAALTGTAGDLLLAVWRRVPLEVLTVDGDGLQAAAMIGLVSAASSRALTSLACTSRSTSPWTTTRSRTSCATTAPATWSRRRPTACSRRCCRSCYDPTAGSTARCSGTSPATTTTGGAPPVGEALVILRGPDAYITPSWYASKREHGRVVPTWNYVTAHVYGELVVHDDADWVDGLVRRLTDEARGRPAAAVGGRRRAAAVRRRPAAGDRRARAADQPDRGQGQAQPEPAGRRHRRRGRGRARRGDEAMSRAVDGREATAQSQVTAYFSNASPVWMPTTQNTSPAGSSICQNEPMSWCRCAPSASSRATSAGMSSLSMSTCQRGGVP